MTRKERALLAVEALKKEYPDALCSLTYKDPLQLLIATILSAQCTDRMVNQVTPELFAKYRTAEEFAQADPSELEPIIRRCGYYRAKGANIIGACRKIAEEFGGRVPETMEELTSLPGVGRKTANVVLGDAFDVPGLPVDTHIKRLVRLIGLVRQEDPVKIESELCAHLDPGRWSQFSHLLIVHGRTVCKANRPACEGCVLQTICKYGKKHVVQK